MNPNALPPYAHGTPVYATPAGPATAAAAGPSDAAGPYRTHAQAPPPAPNARTRFYNSTAGVGPGMGAGGVAAPVGHADSFAAYDSSTSSGNVSASIGGAGQPVRMLVYGQAPPPSAHSHSFSASDIASGSDVAPPSHVSFSAASSSGLDGSLAGFSLFPRAAPAGPSIGTGTATAPGAGMQYLQAGGGGNAGRAGRVVQAQPTEQERQAWARQQMEQDGSPGWAVRPPPPGVQSRYVSVGSTASGAPPSGMPLPMLSTPALGPQSGAGPTAMAAASTSHSMPSQSIYQPAAAFPVGAPAACEATLGGGSTSQLGADTHPHLSLHSHSRFPANSTSAESSSIDFRAAAAAGDAHPPALALGSAYTSPLLSGPPGDENAQPQPQPQTQTLTQSQVQPYSTTATTHAALAAAFSGGADTPATGPVTMTGMIPTSLPSARALAAARSLRLQAHLQLGLAVPSSKAPELDPAVLPGSDDSSGSGSGSSTPGGFLGVPLPSPAETASLRNRAFYARRKTALRDGIVRASVFTELDSLAREADRLALRRQCEAQAVLWQSDRFMQLVMERNQRRDARRAAAAAAAGASAVAGGGIDATSSTQQLDHEVSVSDDESDFYNPATQFLLSVPRAQDPGDAREKTFPLLSQLNSALHKDLMQLMRSQYGPDGRPLNPNMHRNAMALMSNENRSFSYMLQQQYAALQPQYLADWALAPPVPGSYNTASRHARTTAALAPPALPLTSVAPHAATANRDENEDPTTAADGDKVMAKGKDTSFGLAATTRSDFATALSAPAAPATTFFSARQPGAELGCFAPAWDAGPCGRRRRGAAELEADGWGEVGGRERSTRWGRR